MRRRDFLELFAAGAFAWPRAARAFERRTAEGGAPDDDGFWTFVREQFSIPRDRIYLNNGTLGPPPRLVVDATAEHERRVAATFPPTTDWDALKGGMSELLGGDPEGWVFPRNTTEAISFVANGLDIDPGDELVVTDHEHIGGKSAWELLAERRGAALRRATLPVPAVSSDQLEEAVLGQVTARTRVVCLSHVTFTTGTCVPVRDLGTYLEDRGITFVVDGAHPPGMLDLDLGDVPADFYASSPHKWLLAPRGTGLLYLAERWRERLWPSVASGGWDDRSLGAHRLNHLGTMDESRLTGLAAAVAFHRALGSARVESRIRHLRGLLDRWLRQVPGLLMASADDPGLQSGMVAFAVEGIDSLDLQRHLARTLNARTRVIGEYGYGWMRLSVHVYTSPAELERVVEVIDAVARSGTHRGTRP
jgi:selenocysteine lyase/cysteine desulfurase